MSTGVRILVLSLYTLGVLFSGILYAAPVAVRYVEGSAHGFLLLRSLDGGTLGHGEQLQVQRDGGVESRLIMRFNDGSINEETVFFSQRQVFTMQNYRLVQRGPSFRKPLDASLARATGRYEVKFRKENDKSEEFDRGGIDLPGDVYNGMQSIVLKNLPTGATETVHLVAFTPKPKIIKLELSAASEDPLSFGGMQKKATHYLVKPKLGVLGPIASLLGKHPPDYHYWMGNGEPPAFLAFEGPFYADGPIWRVELTVPQLPKRR
jgi:hypothetical protein